MLREDSKEQFFNIKGRYTSCAARHKQMVYLPLNEDLLLFCPHFQCYMPHEHCHYLFFHNLPSLSRLLNDLTKDIKQYFNLLALLK